MSNIITINPLTRISGFLEIQVEVKNNIIINARSSGMYFRGFEIMLKGRPPLDAIYFSERICGICSAAHSLASTLALEDILNIKPNSNDKMLRDFIHGCEFLQNHLRHFYLFTLPDFVKGPELQPVYGIKHADYRLPEHLNKEIAEHYIESVEYSRLSHEMQAILGGKAPHNHGSFVGGVTVNIDASKIVRLKSILSSIKEFTVNKMITDVYIIAEYYKDYFKNGIGYKNLMTYGSFNSYKDKELFYVGPQVYYNNSKHEFDPDYITENVHRAWYEQRNELEKPTEQPLEENVFKKNAYSWIKAPRYLGQPMEVGPLARMFLSGIYDRGISTMDRTIARVLEVKKICDILESILDRIEIKTTEQGRYEFSEDIKGRGLIDTTRGSLGHWINVKNNSIENYGIISPSTWNLSPEDSNGIKGVVEEALIGTYINDVKNPVEIGRIVRSYDPCVSCATHVISDEYTQLEIRVV